MKYLKIIGLFCLFCFTFIYTDKIIDVTIEQDEIMIKIKEYAESHNINPTNATIKDDTIIPGNTSKHVDINSSYKLMKKYGYFSESNIIYKEVYPKISIYNNYNKYIINGNSSNKSISLLYILNNDKTLDNILTTINKYNISINFFIDSTYLSNNINIINKLLPNEIYNYGLSGKYTKDNLIITNNIINNKSNNNSNFCLFLEKDSTSLDTCANNKMLSLIPTKGSYQQIKTSLKNGNIFLINNTKELPTIIEYILSKGFKIIPLSNLIKENIYS